MTRTPLAIAALALAGCEGTTGLDLELLPSPELNSVTDLVGRVRTLVVVIDAAAGRLYPPEAEQPTGDVQIKNADADPGDLELVAIVPVPPDRLPTIRIERGGLPDVPLHVRIIGNADDGSATEMARGGATGINFVEGEVTPVVMPFNLLPRFLPLMVTEVAPGDGELVECGERIPILTVFSRSIDAATITPPGRIAVTELGVGEVASELTVATSSVEVLPAKSLLAYRLAIATEVTDANGSSLDQVPAMPGLQPYDAEFRLACNGSMSPTMPYCSPATPAGPCPGPPGRFRCDAGTCVPAACDAAGCEPGFACDPATLACEVDCRLYGAETCPSDRPRCNATGACIP